MRVNLQIKTKKMKTREQIQEVKNHAIELMKTISFNDTEGRCRLRDMFYEIYKNNREDFQNFKRRIGIHENFYNKDSDFWNYYYNRKPQ